MIDAELQALAERKCFWCGDPIGSHSCVNSPSGTMDHEWCFGLRMIQERDAALAGAVGVA